MLTPKLECRAQAVEGVDRATSGLAAKLFFDACELNQFDQTGIDDSA